MQRKGRQGTGNGRSEDVFRLSQERVACIGQRHVMAAAIGSDDSHPAGAAVDAEWYSSGSLAT